MASGSFAGRRPGLAWALAIPPLLLGCAGDDGGSGPGPTTGTGETGASADTTASTGSEASTSSATGADSSTGADPSTGEATGGSDDAGTGGSGTDTGGLPPDHRLLQNDSWTSAAGLVWQTWPGPDDCWASVFDVPAADSPYDVVAVQVAIGGAGGTESFRVGIWEVDGNNMPATEIDSAVVDIEGNVGMKTIDLAAEGLSIPTFATLNFAAVMCHVDHMGSPSIATDADGTIDADNNWVFQKVGGKWMAAEGFGGIAGDFIFRAIIDTAP